jgi:hypothetical protein
MKREGIAGRFQSIISKRLLDVIEKSPFTFKRTLGRPRVTGLAASKDNLIMIVDLCFKKERNLNLFLTLLENNLLL